MQSNTIYTNHLKEENFVGPWRVKDNVDNTILMAVGYDQLAGRKLFGLPNTTEIKHIAATYNKVTGSIANELEIIVYGLHGTEAEYYMLDSYEKDIFKEQLISMGYI